MHNLYRFALAFLCMRAPYFRHAKSLWNLRILYRAIAIYAHRAYVDQMALRIIFHNRQQNIQCCLCIIGVSLLYCL